MLILERKKNMELIQTDDYYILLDGEHTLWCNRYTGQITPRQDANLLDEDNPTCLGHIYGIIGKITIYPEFPPKLLIIKHQNQIGSLPGGHRVYNINQIAVLNITCSSNLDKSDLDLEPCRKCYFINNPPNSSSSSSKASKKAWKTLQLATATTRTHRKHQTKEMRDKEKFERQIIEELLVMFNDTNFFYYSPTGDITNSMQRQYDQTLTRKVDLPLWQRVDDRFFWNKHMMCDLIAYEHLADRWIIPIIQGFIQIESCALNYNENSSQELSSNSNTNTDKCKILLISRRSRHREGTRYKRRGLDDIGKCANYVETEQIMEYLEHCLSFVQVRGSIPVFWSQPGYRYRPPPLLDKDEIETQAAFDKHFTEQLSIYEYQTIINLVDQTGREKVLADAYLNHVLNYNNPNLTYVTFDFHQHCRGMRYDNVKLLISNIEDIINDLWYCWIDTNGLICDQKGVFRVNCLDCLDRTNVVQTAFAKAVLEIQFSKLDILPLGGLLPVQCRNTFQLMWTNNGDIISKQYAGTVALKISHTGESRLTEVMKDGYHSANRYYLNAFRDGYRQACYDILQGIPPNDKDMTILGNNIILPITSLLPTPTTIYYNNLSLAPEVNLFLAVFTVLRYSMNQYKVTYRPSALDFMLGHFISDDIFGFAAESELLAGNVSWFFCQAGHVYHLIEDCKKMLISSDEVVLGAWPLIDADPEFGDPAQEEMNIVLMMTKEFYYVAEYDEASDRITQYQRVLLNEIETMELGFEPSLLQSKYLCLRINYQRQYETGYFHMFRSANIRFFKNKAVPIETEKDALEFLGEIVTMFSAILLSEGKKIPFHRGKLEKRKSKASFHEMKISPFSDMYLVLPSLTPQAKNLPENSFLALPNVGTGVANSALSFMMAQIARFSSSLSILKTDENNAEADTAEQSLQALESRHNFLKSSRGILAASGSGPLEDNSRPIAAPRSVAHILGRLSEIYEESMSEAAGSKVAEAVSSRITQSSRALMTVSNTATDFVFSSRSDGTFSQATTNTLTDIILSVLCGFAERCQDLASRLSTMTQPAVPAADAIAAPPTDTTWSVDRKSKMDEEEDLLGSMHVREYDEDSEDLNDDQEAALLADSDLEDKDGKTEYPQSDPDDNENSGNVAVEDEDILDIQADEEVDFDKSVEINVRKKESSESDDEGDDTDAKRRGRFLTERKADDLTLTTKVVREIPESLDSVPLTGIPKLNKQNHNPNQRRFGNDYQRNFNNKPPQRPIRNERRFSPPAQAKFRNQANHTNIHVNPNFSNNQSHRGNNFWESENMKKNFQFQRNNSNFSSNQNNPNVNACQRNLIDVPVAENHHLQNMAHQNPQLLHQNSAPNNPAFQQMNVNHPSLLAGNMNTNNQLPFQSQNFNQDFMPLNSIVNQPASLAMQNQPNMNFMNRGLGTNNVPQSLLPNSGRFWLDQQHPNPNQQSMNFQNASQQTQFQPQFQQQFKPQNNMQPLLRGPSMSGLMENRLQFPGHNVQQQMPYTTTNQMSMNQNQNQNKFQPNSLTQFHPNYPPPQIRPNNRNQTMNSNQKWQQAPGMHNFGHRGMAADKSIRPKAQGYSSALTVIQTVSHEQLKQQGHIGNQNNEINLSIMNRNKRQMQQPFVQTKQQKLEKPMQINVKQNQSNIKEVPMVTNFSAVQSVNPIIPAIMKISQNKSTLPIEDEEDEQTKILRRQIEEQKKKREAYLREKEEKRRERKKALQQVPNTQDFSNSNTNIEVLEIINVASNPVNKLSPRPSTSASLIGPNLINYAPPLQPKPQTLQNAVRMPNFARPAAIAHQFSGQPVRMRAQVPNRANLQFQTRAAFNPGLMNPNALGQPKFQLMFLQTNPMENRNRIVVIENLAAATTQVNGAYGYSSRRMVDLSLISVKLISP
uniref:SAC domain-containing protein n=1 Tax=Strigamia maritima TaxID=126957 RepID=T1IJ69_STRMM